MVLLIPPEQIADLRMPRLRAEGLIDETQDAGLGMYHSVYPRHRPVESRRTSHMLLCSRGVSTREAQPQQIQGKAQLAEVVRSDETTEFAKLIVDHVITHGKAGSVNGIIRQQGGRSRR